MKKTKGIYNHTGDDTLVSIKERPNKMKLTKTEDMQDMKKRHQTETNAFPMSFAFSNEQLEDVKKKLDCEPKDMLSLGSGCFIRKRDKKELNELLERHEQERKEGRKVDKFIYEQFLYELGNHEYCITYDPNPSIEACGLTVSEVNENKRLKKIFKKAVTKYLKESEA